MRAILLSAHGGNERLRYEPSYREPKPAEREVVIRVRACSLNYHDVFTRRGMPGIRVPLPLVIGIDIAGEVATLGSQVKGWQVGDAVLVNPRTPIGLIGEMRDGGLAEFCAVPAECLVRIPKGVSFEAAAALPVAYGTAHRMMHTIGEIRAGERVLIWGASGGVGTCALLLAKLAGAYVVACTGSPEKTEQLRSLGADDVIDTSQEKFVDAVVKRFGKPQRRSDEGGVDVIVNFTGGDTWVPSLKALRRGGKLLTCGATAGFDPPEDLRYIWSYELIVRGSNGWTTDDLQALLRLIMERRLTPVIDTVLPLERAAEGLQLIEERKVFGKVLICPG